jgi:hypothetical protein
LGKESGCVKALQLLAGNIILPVCPCNTEQLECPDFACMRKMRASAKIDKFTLAIKTKDGVFL